MKTEGEGVEPSRAYEASPGFEPGAIANWLALPFVLRSARGTSVVLQTSSFKRKRPGSCDAWPVEKQFQKDRCYNRERMLPETGEGVDDSLEFGLRSVLAVLVIIISSIRSLQTAGFARLLWSRRRNA
jgi:hypothetical protein